MTNLIPLNNPNRLIPTDADHLETIAMLEDLLTMAKEHRIKGLATVAIVDDTVRFNYDRMPGTSLVEVVGGVQLLLVELTSQFFNVE